MTLSTCLKHLSMITDLSILNFTNKYNTSAIYLEFNKNNFFYILMRLFLIFKTISFMPFYKV